jgi:aldose 1-epimerase
MPEDEDGKAARGLVLVAGDARVSISPADGGRIRSVQIRGQELLVTASPDGPLYWGCYPMAPWAGRIRRGRFTFAGRDITLPPGMPPHAIHGVVFDRPWRVVDDRTLAVELGPPWPFRGSVTQRFELASNALVVSLELLAVDAMPAVVGWHPWFRRDVAGAAVELDFRPGWMLPRDADGIPTGDLIPPAAGPWDDAFTAVAEPAQLRWPGRLQLEIASTCDWWVAYTTRPDALCLEPQSGPPDAVNLAGSTSRGIGLGPTVLQPGETLRRTMTWRWTVLAA